jgi:hypothetical protein
MIHAHVIWDLPDDQDGNVEHLAEHGIMPEEAEEVLFNRQSETTQSRSSGENITFGETAAGRYLAVVWEHVDDDPLTLRPVTAFDAPRPRWPRRI